MDLRPHSFNPVCECHHCSRTRSSFDDDELHDLNFCPCPKCLVIREKANFAERVKAEEADRVWRAMMLKRFQRQKETQEVEIERMLEDDDDKRIIGDIFSPSQARTSKSVGMIKSHQRKIQLTR